MTYVTWRTLQGMLQSSFLPQNMLPMGDQRPWCPRLLSPRAPLLHLPSHFLQLYLMCNGRVSKKKWRTLQHEFEFQLLGLQSQYPALTADISAKRVVPNSLSILRIPKKSFVDLSCPWAPWGTPWNMWWRTLHSTSWTYGPVYFAVHRKMYQE